MRRSEQPAGLPPDFAELGELVPAWALANSTARLEKRLTTPLSDIRAFYDRVLPRAPAALAFLAERQLGALSPEEENLLKVLLSLAEMGPAIEWYGTGSYPDPFDARRFPLVVTLPDNAPQGVPS